MNRLKQRNKLRWIGNECLFLGPAIVAFVMIIVVPFGMSLVYSFTSWNGVASQVTFNGIENYKALLSDTQFHKSFLFTAKYALAVVVCSNLFAFFLAGLLARPCRISTFFRSVFFVPYAMSAFVLGFIWQFIFTKGFPILGELTGSGFLTSPGFPLQIPVSLQC